MFCHIINVLTVILINLVHPRLIKNVTGPKLFEYFKTHFFIFLVVNDTLGELNSVNITAPDTTQWVLHDLREENSYKFYLRACTHVGCGSAISEEGITVPEACKCAWKQL